MDFFLHNSYDKCIHAVKRRQMSPSPTNIRLNCGSHRSFDWLQKLQNANNKQNFRRRKAASIIMVDGWTIKSRILTPSVAGIAVIHNFLKNAYFSIFQWSRVPFCFNLKWRKFKLLEVPRNSVHNADCTNISPLTAQVLYAEFRDAGTTTEDSLCPIIFFGRMCRLGPPTIQSTGLFLLRSQPHLFWPPKILWHRHRHRHRYSKRRLENPPADILR